MPELKGELTVGELAARAGVKVSTLHFYEAEGLIWSNRTRANHRRYPRRMLRRIAVIRLAQRVGLPLQEIKRAFAELPTDRLAGAQEWTHMATGWQAHIEQQIARLTDLRDRLNGCIGCGCMSLETCPLYNPDDKDSAKGPGAARLTPL